MYKYMLISFIFISLKAALKKIKEKKAQICLFLLSGNFRFERSLKTDGYINIVEALGKNHCRYGSTRKLSVPTSFLYSNKKSRGPPGPDF